ncbi:hypothetical protein [Robinsoniella peoriensis]|uniref:Uncharacterized protein n=1 Tax=Robinsoniella peoriensis TaxID=180332 RepID=A0A4U8Q8Q5_9FIRM|nr:hypothetical protein [Robinsoniella peoriensis]MDU7028125.1 hypothetical protein [Clostridiales bacterium]TLD01352.1 hypothetical protein DSM106044_01734 [Robinsoniella peoriensis]
MINQRIILIDTGSESNQIMMSDVGKMDNAIQLSDLYQINSHRIMKRIFQIHFGFILNKKYEIPLKSLWDKRCVLNQLLFDSNQEYYLILVNDVIRKLSNSYLKKINEMNKVHTFVLLLDSYDKIQPFFRRCINKVKSEKVYSFQKSDCVRYGFKYINTLYSKVELVKKENNFQTDIYFVGAEKGRMEEISKIFNFFFEKGFKCKFDVIVSNSSLMAYREKYPGINFQTKRIGYKYILKDIQSSKCILELCQEGQDGLTMRFYEAIFYNKCLFTNNNSALCHELYNKDYMKVFHSIEDIDVGKEFFDQKVDYHYNNQMSPVHLIEKIMADNELDGGFLI